jgi:uncharacterized protein YbjT (DUF2867 family)
MKRNVLVVGATGTVGAEALRALGEKRGEARVSALVRGPRALPPGVEPVRGDLRDPDSLDRALAGVDAALFVAPHETDEEALAETFVRACEKSGTRIVFVGVHVDGGSALSRALKRALFGLFFAHYRPKFRLAERVRTSRANPIVLMPPNYFQNDELFAEDLLAGTFSQPFERPVNRVDVRDLGDAAARALLDPSLPSGAYPVLGPESLSAEDCAAAWSKALGREIRVDRDGTWRQTIGRVLQGKKREDFLATYTVIPKFAFPTDPKQLAQTSALLGRPPRSYADYVREAAARLRARKSAAVDHGSSREWGGVF